MAAPQQISLLVPLDAHIAPSAVVGLSRLVFRLTESGRLHSLLFGEGGVVDNVRNDLVEYVLDSTSGATHVMWAAPGIVVPEGATDPLLSRPEPVVSTMAARRERAIGGGALAEAGMGFALVETDVYRRMQERFGDRDWYRRSYGVPEEAHFFARCSELGLELGVEDSIRCPLAWQESEWKTSIEPLGSTDRPAGAGSGARVALACPLFEPVAPQALISFLTLVRRAVRDGTVTGILFTDGLYYDAARNILVEDFLASSQAYTHLLWVDSDMTLPLDALSRLLGAGKQVVSGLYHLKRGDYRPAVFNPDFLSAPYTAELSGLRQVEGFGLGITLAERGVFERMAEHFGDRRWFQNGEDYGEDVWWFRRCKAMGQDVWLDADLRCGHVTDRAVTTLDWQLHLSRQRA